MSEARKRPKQSAKIEEGLETETLDNKEKKQQDGHENIDMAYFKGAAGRLQGR